MIPVRLSYQYDFHTSTIFIPVRLSCQYDFHTGTTFIPVRLWYRYEFNPVPIVTLFLFTRLQYEISYQYESYRYEFIPVAVLERHDLLPVRLSYRCGSQRLYRVEIALIMRTDRLCLLYLFTVLKLLLDKYLVEQGLRLLDLFDREAFGSSCLLNKLVSCVNTP